MKIKALIIPYNDNKEIYIQDRTGNKPPPWGFFGGSVEEGETPLQAVIREAREELEVDVTESEISYLGQLDTEFENRKVARHFFLYPTNREAFTVLEGAGGLWVSFEKANDYLVIEERLNQVKDLVNKATNQS